MQMEPDQLLAFIKNQVCDYVCWHEQTLTARERIIEIAAAVVRRSKQSMDISSQLHRDELLELLVPIYQPMSTLLEESGEVIVCRTVYWYRHMNNTWAELHNYLVANGFCVENTKRFIDEVYCARE